MPITEFLDGFKFDPETRQVMGAAYEMARAALKFDYRTYACRRNNRWTDHRTCENWSG